MRPVTYRMLSLVAVISAAFAFSSCPQPLTEEFVEMIEEDVAVAVALERTLTVTGDGNGVIAQSGVNTVKDGIAFTVEATAFTSHVFHRWVKSAGAGAVSFADAEAPSTEVTVTGGNATIIAEFSARPVVYYATPTGTGIYTNTSIYVYFSNPMDEDALKEPGAVALMKGGTVEIPGEIELVNPTTIRFTPNNYLSPQQYHVIKIAKTVADAEGAEMESEYSATFKTASTADETPPTDVAFNIETTNPAYVDETTITLTGVYALEEGESVSVLITENGGEGLLIPFAEEIEYTFRTSGEGTKVLRLRVVDSVENVSVDYAERTIVYDASDPVIAEFTVHGTGDGTDQYSNTTSVWMTCDVSDSTALEMRFKNGSGGVWSAWSSWEEEPAISLSGTQGAQTIYAEFRDAAYPADHVSAANYTITLDTTAPASNSMTIDYAGFDAGYVSGTRTVNATVSDALSGIMRVDFYVGGTLRSSDATAPYSFSWATTSYTSGSTYAVYARAYDKAGNLLDSASQNKVVDNVAPAVTSAYIPGTGDGSNTYVNTTSVTLQHSVSDSYSMQMRHSNNNSTWTTWETYAATKAFSLTATDGYRYVYFQFRDAAGNVTATSDYVYLDRVAPTSAAFTINYAGSDANYVSGTRTVTCTPSDAIAVWKVDFYINGVLAGTDTASPYSYSWVTTGYGNASYPVYCKAYDRAGNTLNATSVNRIVDNAAPAVSITSPTAGADIDYLIIPSATASDTNGIWKVVFYAGGTNLGEDTTSSYSAPNSWNTTTLTEGSTSYSVYAIAYDWAGNATTSAYVYPTIDNWDATYVLPADVGTSGSSYGLQSAIASYNNGSTLYMAYLDYTNLDLDLVKSTDSGATWTAGGTIEATNVSSSTKVSLAVDSSGYLHAVWSNGAYVYYSKSTTSGASWSTDVMMSSSAASGEKPVVTVKGGGATAVIHVGWIQFSSSNYYIYYRTSLDGAATWPSDHYWNLKTGGANVLKYLSISSLAYSTTSSLYVYIVWQDYTNKQLYIIAREASTGLAGPFSAKTIGETDIGDYASVSAMIGGGTISPFEDVVLVTCGDGASGVRLIGLTSTDYGATFTQSTIQSSAQYVETSALVTRYSYMLTTLRYYNRYQVAYYRYSSGDLYIAKSTDGTTWYNHIIDTAGTVGKAPTMLGSSASGSSTLHIGYYDVSNQDLNYAKVIINY